MDLKLKFLLAIALSALGATTAFARSGAHYRDYGLGRQPSFAVPAAHSEPSVLPRTIQSEPKQALPARRFTLPTGTHYEHSNPGLRASPVTRPAAVRMSPEQRRTLRRQINEMNQDLRYQRRY